MSEQKHVLVEVSTYSEWTNGATFAIIPPEAYARARAYQEELKRMKENGLNPYRISEFYYGIVWLEELPAISPDLAEKLDVVAEGDCDLEFYLEEAFEEERPFVSTIEELCGWEDEKENALRVECDTINVQDDGFTFKAHIKHTDVQMETKRLGCKYLKPTPLSENDYIQEMETPSGEEDGCLIDNDGDAETDMEELPK